MRVAVYYNNRDIRIEDVPVPKIRGNEILVKIEASGICGSDVMEWYRIKKAPLVLGHEIAGTVAEAGSRVTRFRPGDRVTVAHHVPCNTCRYCLAGNHSVCDILRTTNFDPGGFAEYVRVPEINVDRGVFLLPRGMSFEEGTFSEPLGCVVRGLGKARMEAGKSILVIGSGMAGLLYVKLAKALGAGKIIATDLNEFRLNAAKRFGADHVFKAESDVPAMVKDALGRFAEIVVLSVASAKAVEQAIKSVDRGGVIVFFAPMEPGKTFPMPLFDLWRDNITIINPYASPPRDTLTALELIHAGRVNVSDMITHRLGLGETGAGFKIVSEAKESIKVIIEPQR